MDFREKIASLVSKKTKLKKVQVFELLSKPPEGMGDYALPLHQFAKELKKEPIAISKELAAKMSSDFLEKVEPRGPYLNFFISKGALAKETLEGILSKKWSLKGKGKGKVMVEYSSPNTNKPLHIGHLRNNSIGMAYSNLLLETGHKVIRANLINDRGIHLSKAMLAYKLFGEGKTPESEGKKPDHFVGDMYVLFNERVKENESLNEKAQELLKKWEANDKETLALWKQINDWTFAGIKETYKNFGTEFDEWFFESEFYRKGKGQKIVEEGLKKGIFVKEDDAIIAKLEPELQDKVLVRKDGTSLYITNDLGVTEEKFKKFKPDKSIWVVANEQNLYFQQLFKIFEKLGRSWSEKCFHLNYGYVSLPSGKMKSREGTVIDADDLIESVKELAKKEIEARYKKLGEKEKNSRALAIALSAIKFHLLKNDAKKDMVFEPEKSISFEGETGPYLQYTYARARSILRKAGKYKPKDFELLTHEKEKELILVLTGFGEAVEKSLEFSSLHPIAHNLLLIAERFNSFYHELPVIKAGKEKEARLALVEATTIVLKKGLELLGIEAIEEM